MEPELAITILMLREVLDELIGRKLENPNLDMHGRKGLLDPSYFGVSARRSFLHGDRCEGHFFFGRKVCAKKDGLSPKASEQLGSNRALPREYPASGLQISSRR
ncbi:hypothetical protein R1sor_003951 [Riccia sorocarpa]|uniref:RNA helicase C-terminal domain-containing protein n=1 Tax=Riccia sorocarpa TaxID=122646 RepID=A0ABD3H711_9MARC